MSQQHGIYFLAAAILVAPPTLMMAKTLLESGDKECDLNGSLAAAQPPEMAPPPRDEVRSRTEQFGEHANASESRGRTDAECAVQELESIAERVQRQLPMELSPGSTPSIVSFDVRNSESLVSPLVGTINFRITSHSKPNPADEIRIEFRYVYTWTAHCAYQNRRRVLKLVERTITKAVEHVEADKEGFAASYTRAESVERTQSLLGSKRIWVDDDLNGADDRIVRILRSIVANQDPRAAGSPPSR